MMLACYGHLIDYHGDYIILSKSIFSLEFWELSLRLF